MDFCLQEMRVFNTWMGDAARMEIMKAMLEVIERDNVMSLVVAAGNELLSGLEKLQVCEEVHCRTIIFLFLTLSPFICSEC